jgi:hypothetical protein
MSSDARIREFAAGLEREGRSSPHGAHWHTFHQKIIALAPAAATPPPPPLILAASGESNASKLRRLVEHLRWAATNGILDEAIALLEALPRADWNSGNAERWHRSNYPGWD